MRPEFTPLDTDIRYQNLVYVSEAKLKQLLLDPERQGFTFNLPVASGGFGMDTKTLGTRELLSRAGKLFKEQGLLNYEINPQPNKWLLVRAKMACGTAWPWAGYDDEAANTTAWWVGNSSSLRILAYGHRDHVLGLGKMPPSPASSSRTTWWPSRSDGYVKLLKNVAGIVSADDLNVAPKFGAAHEAAKILEGLENYFFSNSGVVRDSYLVNSGTFEMLLRVDAVVESSDPPAVFGSPLWVSRETRPVPGTYEVENLTGVDQIETVADWDGRAWSSIQVLDHRDPFLRTGQQPSEDQLRVLANKLGVTPKGPPSIEQLMSLRRLGNPNLGEGSSDEPQPSELTTRSFGQKVKQFFGGNSETP